MEDRYLDINLNALHEECRRQAELYSDHAKAKAQADKDSDTAKNLLKLAGAKLDAQIRETPERFGLKRATDEGIKQAIIRNPLYQRLAKALIQADYDAAVHAANVEAIRQKKDMLEQAVKLRLADYFADPVLPRQEQEAIDKASKADVRSRGQR